MQGNLVPSAHNPLVLGSNPSGPTNQPVEAAAVRKIDVSDCHSSIGQLKLFSQLFEAEIHGEAKDSGRHGPKIPEGSPRAALYGQRRIVWVTRGTFCLDRGRSRLIIRYQKS